MILFSATELIAGAMLMTGLLTRAAALVSIAFAVLLMAMFGWQGATCIDEWTMAACNLAMGTTLLLGGRGAFSLDNVLLRRKPQLADSAWFRWLGGALPLPQSDIGFRNLGLALFAFVAVYDVGTYDHFRGSVYGPFHGLSRCRHARGATASDRCRLDRTEPGSAGALGCQVALCAAEIRLRERLCL